MKQFLLFVCLIIATSVIYMTKQGKQETPESTPVADNPLGLEVKSDTEAPKSNSGTGESFSEEEIKIIEEKAKKLAQQDHYDTNVEQLGREKHYDRTSYYDKPIGFVKARGINEIIYAGASELNMRRGVATVEYLEQLDEHTVALAGHRSHIANQYFASAVYLVNGDKITVEQFKEGTKDIVASTDYYVEKVYKVDPSDVYVLEDNKKRKERKLILITCATYDPVTRKYLERWIVEAYAK